MAAKIAIINIGLALLFGFFSIKTYQVWTTETTSVQRALKNAGRNGDDTPAKPKSRASKRSTSRASKTVYPHVTEKNLFSKERSEAKPVEIVAEEIVKSENFRIDGKKIELFGVVITGDRALALISDPDVKNRVRRTRWVKSGDQIGQFKVDAISKTDIIFSEGSERFKVVLWDQRKDRERSTVAVRKNPTVVDTNQAPEPRSKPDTVSVESAKPPEKDAVSDEAYVIIKTPFGDVKRKK